MPDSLRPYQVPRLEVQGEMVGIRLPEWDELVDGPTAVIIAHELNRLGSRLSVTHAGASTEAARIDWDDDSQRRSFMFRAIAKRLGVGGEEVQRQR